MRLSKKDALSGWFTVAVCCLVALTAAESGIPVAQNSGLARSTGTPRFTVQEVNHVLFIPSSHFWNSASDSSNDGITVSHTHEGTDNLKSKTKPLKTDNFKSPAKPLVRHRRKIISRGGHYILRSKSENSPWGGGHGGSQASSYMDGRQQSRGSKSRGSSGIRRGTHQRQDHGRLDGNRYSSRNMKYSQKIRGSRRRTRQLISQSLKMEIGQYALSKGAKEASEKYARRVGRRLKERIIEKFARRFRTKQQRRRDRAKENRQRFSRVY